MLAKDYRTAARSVLAENWATVVLFTILFLAVNSFSAIPILGFVIYPLLKWGYAMAFYNQGINKKDILFSDLFSGFKTNGKNWLVIFLRDIYTTLWSILLVVPGIVKAYSYSMAVYILHENPDLSVGEALRRSQKLMDGHKGALFGTHLTLIGWFILSVLTFGVGFFWLIPYAEAINIEFYKSIKPVSYISTDASTEQGYSKEIY